MHFYWDISICNTYYVYTNRFIKEDEIIIIYLYYYSLC